MLLGNKAIKRVMFLMFALFVGLSANAADIEPVELQLGKEYHGEAFKDAYFKFTSAENGKLIIRAKGDLPTPYIDDTFETEFPEYSQGFTNGLKELEMVVSKGTTYYFAYKFPISEWTMILKMADISIIKMEYANPAPNQEFPLSNGGVEIHFDTPIEIGAAYLQTGNSTAEVSGLVYGKDISFELKETLFSWLKSGAMKAGDTFTLTVNDIKSTWNGVLYNGDGKLVLTYISSEKPAEVTKATLPEKFLSFWNQSAENGIAIIEYDKEISTEATPIASIGFGSPEIEGDYYEENIPVTVSGKTLTLDFRGKSRIPSEMVASGTNYGTMRLRINNICSADGNYVYSEGKGTFGSFQHSFDYELMAYDLTTEFTPASGSSLTDVNSVELWLSNAEAVTFDGVNVAYKSATGANENVTYTNEQCNYKNEGVDGITLNIPITADMQTGTNVTITLTNLVSNDGIEREIMAVYNPKEDFKPVMVTPADMSQIESLTSIVLTYNAEVSVVEGAQASVMNAMGRMEVAKANISVDATDTKSVIITVEKAITDAGVYRVLIPAEVISNAAGEKNEAITLMYEVKAAVASFTFTPADGSTVKSLKEIIVEYSGVLMPSWSGTATLRNAMGEIVTTASADSYIPEDKMDDFSYEPTGVILTLATEITVPGTYTLNLPAGYLVCGASYDMSEELNVTYTIEGDPASGGNFIPVSITPAEGEVKELSKFILTFDAWAGELDNTEKVAVLKNAEGNEVAIGSIAYNDDDYCSVDVTLNQVVAAPGTYTLTVPAGVINNNEGNDYNPELTYTYTIAGSTAGGNFIPVSITPAEGEVKELSKFVLTFDAWAGELDNTEKVAVLKNAEGNEVAIGSIAYNDDDYCSVDVTLNQVVVAPGTYTLIVPAGVINNNEGNDYNPELTYTFIITDGTGIESVIGEQATNVTVYTINGVRVLHNADKAELKQLKPGIYVINGKKVYIRK